MAQGDLSRININISAITSLNSLKGIQRELGTHQLRLATGRRINESADDPAGLTIATKFQYRVVGLGVALDNIGDAKNMLAVAEGGLTKIKDILIQMRAKAEQAASDTMGSSERTAIKNQLTDFKNELDNLVSTTTWNGMKLLDGLTQFDEVGGVRTITFQVGASTASADRFELSATDFAAVDTSTMGVSTIDSTTVATAANARTYIQKLDTAIDDHISKRLQTIGTFVSRLNFREDTLTTAKLNTDAAFSRIINADMAMEQLEATKLQILQQTATTMLGQANQNPQILLSLFRG